MTVNLTPAQLASADQFYTAATRALDKALTDTADHYAKGELSDPVLVSALAYGLRPTVAEDPQGAAGMLAVALVRLMKARR